MHIEPTTEGTLHVFQEWCSEQLPCDLLQCDKERAWLVAERILAVGSDVKISAKSRTLIGTVESCTKVSTGCIVLVHVHQSFHSAARGQRIAPTES